MDKRAVARDFSQMGQENPRVPTSPGLDYDELFRSVFDWELYCDSTRSSSDQTSSSSSSPCTSSLGRNSHRDLPSLITEIQPFLDHLSLDRDGSGYLTMTPGLSPDHGGRTSSESMGQTPPELIRGGSTSPSDYSGSVFLDAADEGPYRRRPQVSLEEFQAQDDKWTYPQAMPNKHTPRGYPPRIQVRESSSRRGSPTQMQTQTTSGIKRQRSSSSSLDKRSRHLSDPDQTADVRKSGACLPCRISKTRCQDCGVCPHCRKAFPDHSHLVCTRRTPAVAPPVIRHVADVWSPNPAEERRCVDDPRFPTAKPRDILIFFTREPDAPYLRASVQAYHSQNGLDENPRNAAFERDRFPSYAELQRWVEAQIKRERSSTHFEHAVQNFLLSYSEGGYDLPKHKLVSKVHTMNCFFRIWKAPPFTCCSSSNKFSHVPFTVQAELRRIAWKALVSHEHDILKLLEECLAQQEPLKPRERMAVWASLWQLLLMYRELVIAHDNFFMRNPNATRDPAVAMPYDTLYNVFFPLIAIFYHCQFKTPKRLEMPMDWLKESATTGSSRIARIHQFSKDMMNARKGFYEGIQRSPHKIDERLSLLVVSHELKKLSTKRRSKPSGKSKSGSCDDG